MGFLICCNILLHKALYSYIFTRYYSCHIHGNKITNFACLVIVYFFRSASRRREDLKILKAWKAMDASYMRQWDALQTMRLHVVVKKTLT